MNQLKALALSLVAAPASLYATNAPPAVEAAKESCSNIEWNPAFLQDYPTATAACREVIVKDGVKYSTFNGTVSKVGKEFLQVQVSDAFNNALSMIAFKIGAGGKVTVGNKVEEVEDIQLGDNLTFWVREGRFGVSPTPTDQPMTILTPR
jgi:hypothetical protein